MQRRFRHVPLALLLLSGPAAAAPDGFTDCAKAEMADEKAICGNTRLIQQDARMVTLYEVATSLAGMGTRGDLKDGQAKWLDARHDCKADIACLGEAYGKRIEQLKKIIDAVASRGPF